MTRILLIFLLLFAGGPFLISYTPAGTPHEEQEEFPIQEEGLKLREEILEEFDIHLEKAHIRDIPRIIELPGEVVADPDREVHVVPVARGFVRRVYKRWGDPVKAGEILAEIDSPELADLKARYLAAKSRLALTEELYRREKLLWRKKITAEENFLKVQKELELARLEVKTLEQKLLTLGFSPQGIREFENGQRPLGRYVLRSPISGRVVEKHLVQGEMVDPGQPAFKIADLSVVWVLVSVYREWLPKVRQGQKVWVSLGKEASEIEAHLDYLNPILDPETRAARGRIVLKNPSGILKPGLLVRVKIALDESEKGLFVPASALQRLRGHTVIFVKTKQGFVPREVKIGRRWGKWVEILEGLQPGEEYVTRGALILKAELEKESLESGHVH